MLGEHPHLTLTHWAERYGPLMHLGLGSINTVVASLLTMAKEILKTQDRVFQYRPSSLAFKIMRAWEWYMVLLCNTSKRYAWTSFSHLKRYNHSNLWKQKRFKIQSRTFLEKPMRAKWLISPSNYHLFPQIIWPKCCSRKSLFIWNHVNMECSRNIYNGMSYEHNHWIELITKYFYSFWAIVGFFFQYMNFQMARSTL